MAQVILNGQIVLAQANKPIPGVRIEIWNKSGMAFYNQTAFNPLPPLPSDSPDPIGLPLDVANEGYGWIAGSFADQQGYFTIVVNDPPALLITPEAVLVYRLYKNNVLIYETTPIDYTLLFFHILVEDAAYDLLFDTDGADLIITPYVNFVGRVFDVNGATVDKVNIYVYENGFRTKTLLANTHTDLYGNYKVKVNTSTISNSYAIAGRGIRIEVTDIYDDFIAASDDIFNWESQDEIKIDFNTQYTNTTPEFNRYSAIIQDVIGSADIASLSYDPHTNTNEFVYVAGASGLSIAVVQNIAAVYLFSEETGLNVDILYAISKVAGGDTGYYTNLTEQQVRDAIANAMASNIIIPYLPTPDIDAFIDQFRDLQLERTKSTYITGETYQLNDVMLSFFSTQIDVDNFLNISNEPYDDQDAFWAAYEAAYGPTLTATAKQGMQLVSITEYQPQTLTAIITQLAGDDTSLTGSWDYDIWLTLIANTCSITDILCVPAAIRNGATDPHDPIPQQDYARILLAVTQALYPMAYLNNQLQDSTTGPQIILDGVTRANVITFINNNPTFDSRKTTVYQINSHDWNLSGITDLSLLQAGLLPFQRVLRMVVANPVAACSLIIDGVTSARDIAQMGLDQFRENYTSLFPLPDKPNPTAVAGLNLPNVDQVFDNASLNTAWYQNMLVNASLMTLGTYRGYTASAPILPPYFITPPTESFAETPHLAEAPHLAFASLSAAVATSNPALTALFGSMDYCNCCDCKSVYSPAAYLTDTLNFIKTNSTTTNNIYLALNSRRPDIINIDLTCANSDTPVPYIDLVNEVLELQILYGMATLFPAYLPADSGSFSFQTSGTEEQLAAYPEHTYKFVSTSPAVHEYRDFTSYSGGGILGNSYAVLYGKLSSAIYPYNLPFSLPIEEARVYTQHLGISRLDLMKLFCPINQATVSTILPPPSDKITNYSIYAEWLGLTKQAATIVTGSYTGSTGDPHFFYGASAGATSISTFPDPFYGGTTSGFWRAVISGRVDMLLQQVNITYDELLQYLTTDYLNPISSGVRPIGITAITGAPTDTCQLHLLELTFSTTAVENAFFDKFHRFIRLVNTGKLSIYQWDILLRSTLINSAANGIDDNNFQQLGQLLLIADELNIAPEILAMWWNNIDNTVYLDYPNGSVNPLPTLYQTIFNSKNVINNNSSVNIFSSTTYGTNPYLGNTAQIANFCGITENEVIALLGYLGIILPTYIILPILSRLYILATLSRSLNLMISDLLTICKLSGFTVNNNNLGTGPTPPPPLPTLADYLNNLQTLIDTVNHIKKSPFSLAQLNYLVASVDPSDPIAPDPLQIQQFLESIRSELNKNTIYDPAHPDTNLLNKLTNIIYQHFSKEFGMSLQLVTEVFTATSGSDAILDFLNSDFVPSSYPLSESVVLYIDGGTIPVGDPIPVPPAIVAGTDKRPIFQLQSFYRWYRYFFKANLICTSLGLRDREFLYLYLSRNLSPYAIKGVQYDFWQLPIALVGSSVVNVAGSSSTVVTGSTALNGILRMSRLKDIINEQSLPDDSMGKLLDATYGMLTATVDGFSPIGPVTSPSDINQTFTNWLNVINQDSWGTMLYELLGNNIPVISSGTTQNTLTTPPTNPALLNVNYTIVSAGSSSTSNFSPANYANFDTVLNVIEIIKWCTIFGMSPTNVQKLLIENISLDDSRKLIIAARGKYDDVSWAKIAQPLRNEVRLVQRDALVAYQQQTPDQLFANLLIDVAMDACMVTARIKQAISSVQLFIDRIVLGLEFVPGSTTAKLALTGTALNQWTQWRKWYGVWEANRKVFFYPEDWMEPTLRDDKTNLFIQLEADLNQNAITNDTAGTAIGNYLQRLNDISRLEPIATCDQTNLDGTITTHAFARSHGGSTDYYHRTLQSDIWSPWTKVDINIGSNQILPYFWNNNLYIYWLTFKEKSAAYTSKMNTGTINTPATGFFYNDMTEPVTQYSNAAGQSKTYKQIEITLNWTQYKNGKWQSHQTGKESMTLKMSPWLEAAFIQFFYENISFWLPPYADANSINVFNSLTNNGQMSILDMVKSRFYLSPYVHTTGMTNPITTSGASVVDGDLYLMVMFPLSIGHDTLYGSTEPIFSAFHSENTSFIKAFHLSQTNGDKNEITQNMLFYKRLIMPSNLLHQNMALTTYKSDLTASVALSVDLSYTLSTISMYNYDTESNYTDGAYSMPSSSSSSTNILASSLSKYKVYTKSGFYNPLEDKFGYEDNVNTFFARKVSTGYYLYVSGGPIYIPPTWVPVTPYYFQTFYHPQIGNFIGILNEYGVDGLMRPDLLSSISTPPVVQQQIDSMGFNTHYGPTSQVSGPSSGYVSYTSYPSNIVDFNPGAAYSIYNWELFFHTPMLIAGQLSTNQQFADARKWYHYIFDPTSTTYLSCGVAATSASQMYWKFFPFYQLAGGTITTIDDLLAQIQAGNLGALQQLHASEDDPFEPFAIGRTRPLAFMKNVVMKYLDNLIAWGDYLFTQDTIESINEATQLYILASDILGNKPAAIPQRVETLSYTFKELVVGGVDELGDAMVAVEGYIDPSVGIGGGGSGTMPNVLYFCLEPNDKLLTYWDTVADRLYKIRHCENISGIKQKLPIYEPPIDPALLVQAKAAGIDINSVLNDLSGAGLSNYRYSYMVQKANEFCGEVRALGGALLSALEKKDAEALALLRQGQEINLLNAILRMKQQQIDEANANIEALNGSLAIAEAKLAYYNSLPYSNSGEQQYLGSLQTGMGLQIAQGALQAAAGVSYLVPQFHAQALYSIGTSEGGKQYGDSFNVLAAALGSAVAINNTVGSMASTKGGWDRRWADWQFQAQSAQLEINQIQKQITAATIRVAIAQADYDNQQLQIDNANAINDFMTNKYTNKQLYTWMVGQLSDVCFRAYQLAYNMAKKAELCFQRELPLSAAGKTGFIFPNSWDSLKKGLLAGELLQQDIRNMESAYISDNTRLLELTKHVSVAMLQPDQLISLRLNGYCTISIPEELYDLDYPGHFNRIIKSVSISIPCVAGPYTTIPCTLTLNGSYVRRDTSLSPEIDSIGNTEIPCSVIATSSAQNDNGMFDFNFRDERYLPFEGAGAVSNWTLSLSNASAGLTTQLRTFDYNTISDVILHIKYTASDGSNDPIGTGTFASTRAAALKADIQNHILGYYPTTAPPVSDNGIPLPRYFSLKHEFPNEWFQFVNGIASGPAPHVMNIGLIIDQFPFFCEGYMVNGVQLGFASRLKTSSAFDLHVSVPYSGGTYTQAVTTSFPAATGTFTTPAITATSAPYTMNITITGTSLSTFDANVDDIYMVLIYKVN